MILPTDLAPAVSLANFVLGEAAQLRGSSVTWPPEIESVAIRLRVKIIAPEPDTPSGRCVLIDVSAIDFSI